MDLHLPRAEAHAREFLTVRGDAHRAVTVGLRKRGMRETLVAVGSRTITCGACTVLVLVREQAREHPHHPELGLSDVESGSRWTVLRYEQGDDMSCAMAYVSSSEHLDI